MFINDSLNMDTRAGQILPTGIKFNQDNKGCLFTDYGPPDMYQAVHKKTVKELLMMRRQKWNCLQDNSDFLHEFKSTKSEASNLLGPPAPVYSCRGNHFHTTPPENGHFIPQQWQHSALQEHVAPTADVKITFFHWQIQQEAQKVGGVTAEQLNMQDADGDTFLHITVAKGRRALAYVLATKMARCGSLDTKEHKGQTALQIAAATNHHLIVHDLLTLGAQINTRDLWGRSPLHLCAERGHFLSLRSIWKTLMGSGQLLDIEMFNYDGLTPLHAAVLSHNAVVRELRGLENLSSDMVEQLVQRSQVYVHCMKTLLLMGASWWTKDLKSGRTCLHMASEEANVELFNIFLNQPSSVSLINAKTFSGNTALHIVSALQNHRHQVEAAKLLMRSGADPGIRNSENELPCQLVPEGPTGEKVWQILRGKHCHA